MPSAVVDASAAVDLLLGGTRAAAVRRALAGHRLAAPAHLDVEVLSALGRLVRADELDESSVAGLLGDLRRTRIRRYSLAQLLQPAWELRHNVALQDAPYVALASRLRAALLTTDSRLARAALDRVTIVVVA